MTASAGGARVRAARRLRQGRGGGDGGLDDGERAPSVVSTKTADAAADGLLASMGGPGRRRGGAAAAAAANSRGGSSQRAATRPGLGLLVMSQEGHRILRRRSARPL